MDARDQQRDRNPQAEQMADESMLRTLRAQAEAIWPQERHIFDRHELPPAARILDVGCGVGEIASRLAERYPLVQVLGIDVLETAVDVARARHAALAPRVRFEVGDAFALDCPDEAYDLTVCRHMLQAVPEPGRALDELLRVTRPGGVLHLLAEDYGMIHMPAGRLDPDRLWHDGVVGFTDATGTDARIGRHIWGLLRQRGVEDLAVEYVTVDTLRVERRTFADIMRAWGDGYAQAIATHSTLKGDLPRRLFDYVVEAIEDPDSYCAWQVPIWTGRKPGSPD